MRYAIVILLLASSFAFGQTVEWDAANLSMEGVDLGAPYVRFMIDNTAELSDLTNVRMSVEIHSGRLGGITLSQDGDEGNPWKDVQNLHNLLFTVDGTLYQTGFIMYPGGSTFELAPFYYGRRQPESPDFVPFDDAYMADKPERYTQEEWDIFRYSEFEAEFNTVYISGTVPSGWELDWTLRFDGIDGSRVEIFSIAASEVTSDQGTWDLTDSDPTPQTVPEPGALVLLVAGGVARLFRRK